jgi:hypothetical protein
MNGWIKFTRRVENFTNSGIILTSGGNISANGQISGANSQKVWR